MSYTFTEVQTFPIDGTFDRLYADSIDDMVGGTVRFGDSNQRELIIHFLNGVDYVGMKNIVVESNDIPCMYLQCRFDGNTLTWVNGLVGKINNSKAWSTTSEFHQANKDWILSLGGNSWAVECLKDAAIDNFFTTLNTAGICLGTLEETDLENNIKQMKWTY